MAQLICKHCGGLLLSEKLDSCGCSAGAKEEAEARRSAAACSSRRCLHGTLSTKRCDGCERDAAIKALIEDGRAYMVNARGTLGWPCFTEWIARHDRLFGKNALLAEAEHSKMTPEKAMQLAEDFCKREAWGLDFWREPMAVLAAELARLQSANDQGMP